MKAAIYVRVSTEDQDPENQTRQLRSLCDARGWPVVIVYRENASGADPSRLAYNEMMRDARKGVFGVLVFWAWDRITRRGIAPALSIMEKWRSWGLCWESLQEPFLSSGADPHMAELLLSIISWAAKQERLRISERTKAGLAQARSRGKRLGRHPFDCRCSLHKEREKSRERHHPRRQIALKKIADFWHRPVECMIDLTSEAKSDGVTIATIEHSNFLEFDHINGHPSKFERKYFVTMLLGDKLDLTGIRILCSVHNNLYRTNGTLRKGHRTPQEEPR